MKINLISDIHLECGDLYLPGGEVLIIAGDAMGAKRLKLHQYKTNFYEENDLHRQDRFARFFIEECDKYEQVIYVMGNHEHYDNKFHKTYVDLVSNLPDKVALLENETLEYKGVLFVGGTLWTDFNSCDPLTKIICKNGMSDYRHITKWDGGDRYRSLKPDDLVDIHMKTKEYIRLTAQNNKDKAIVVITHHAPTLQSIDVRFLDQKEINGAYASELDDLILDNTNIKFWCHGHTHCRKDYMVGDCRVLCNPRGYYGHEKTEFDVNFTFEV